MILEGQKIGFLGGGAMGEAIITGLLRSGSVTPSRIFVSVFSTMRLEYLKQKLGVNATTNNCAVVREADVVILAVKPQIVKSVLEEIAPLVRPKQTLISIAAGITIEFIESFLDSSIPVVRVMPNTPCMVGEGASAVSGGKHTGRESIKKALAIFTAVGKAVEVPESLLDCVSGISGSGPAYMYVILEGLIDGAVRLGLPRDLARVLAAQTMLGASKMVLETEKHPGELKDSVTTPGGSTAAGLFILEEGALRALLMKAVAVSNQRSRELASLK